MSAHPARRALRPTTALGPGAAPLPADSGPPSTSNREAGERGSPTPAGRDGSRRRTGSTPRGLAVALLCGLALLLGAGPALAHTRLLSSDPADGATLDTGPSRVTLTFNESVPAEFASLTVVGPDGTEYQSGDPTAVDGALSTAVDPLGPAGRYQVGYRVVSDDGHPITGAIAFILTADGPAAQVPPAPSPPTAGAPATAAPTAPQAADADDDGGAPVWPWLLGAAVLVGGGVVAALRLGRG
ncbi:MAG TPA: copper resistance CopC family protein [Pseudonocardia sp.]|nr:copper resistance CopC family protein [Pseudonocardia sp.]